MSRSDEHIKELLKATRKHDGMHAIVKKNQILVDYSGEKLDDMEDIPGWEYLMPIAEKLYEQYEEQIEEGTYDWMIFDYGVNRFMVWGELASFIEDMKENAEIEAAYE
jgi:hypothetical protein